MVSFVLYIYIYVLPQEKNSEMYCNIIPICLKAILEEKKHQNAHISFAGGKI